MLWKVTWQSSKYSQVCHAVAFPTIGLLHSSEIPDEFLFPTSFSESRGFPLYISENSVSLCFRPPPNDGIPQSSALCSYPPLCPCTNIPSVSQIQMPPGSRCQVSCVCVVRGLSGDGDNQPEASLFFIWRGWRLPHRPRTSSPLVAFCPGMPCRMLVPSPYLWSPVFLQTSWVSIVCLNTITSFLWSQHWNFLGLFLAPPPEKLSLSLFHVTSFSLASRPGITQGHSPDIRPAVLQWFPNFSHCLCSPPPQSHPYCQWQINLLKHCPDDCHSRL